MKNHHHETKRYRVIWFEETAILATYISEKISQRYRFEAIAVGYLLVSLRALIMSLDPIFILVVIAYFIARFGEILAFPFYRSWNFSKIPKDKASSILSALSSYRRLIALISPATAGFLASIEPTLPYLVSLILFITSSIILILYKYGYYIDVMWLPVPVSLGCLVAWGT